MAGRNPHAILNRFTRRELECIELRCQGLTTFAVGKALGIDYDTAKNHMAHAFRKAEVSSIAEMCRIVGQCDTLDDMKER